MLILFGVVISKVFSVVVLDIELPRVWVSRDCGDCGIVTAAAMTGNSEMA